MTAALLTVGDELLIGQVVNTNAAWIGERLSALGVEVVRAATVGDDEAVIREEILRSLRHAEVLIVTGGLGATHDDVTKRAAAEALGRPLRRDERLLEAIAARFAARGRPMAAANGVMADVPEGFDVLDNPVGTAAGLWFAGPVEGAERVLVLLPGVPREMKALVREAVLPRLVERQGEASVAQKTLLTAGRGETDLAETLGDLSAWLDGRRLAYLPSYGVVRLRLTAFGATRADATERLGAFEAFVRERLGDLVFGENDETLAGVVGRMLAGRGLTLATAESCTGGRIADALTNVAGSSAYFRGGAVVYGNDVKTSLLDVDHEALVRHGAVSEAVARQMAAGVRERLGADLGVAATGVAGPGGGTPEKPVGTVWLGYADAEGTHAVHLRFTADRELNKRLTTTAALNLVRRRLLRREP